MTAPALCVFCLKMPGDPTPFCAANPGRGCTYGLEHEFPRQPAKQPARRPDVSRCLRCGLHPKNPASATNGCTHEYAGGAS